MRIGYIFSKKEYDMCYKWCRKNNATIIPLENNNFQIIEILDGEKVDLARLKRAIRTKYLNETDKYVLSDYPISIKDKTLYVEYRKYLRNFTTLDGFPHIDVLSFDDWKKSINL